MGWIDARRIARKVAGLDHRLVIAADSGVLHACISATVASRPGREAWWEEFV